MTGSFISSCNKSKHANCAEAAPPTHEELNILHYYYITSERVPLITTPYDSASQVS